MSPTQPNVVVRYHASRRMIETMLLALIAMTGVWCLRFPTEMPAALFSEAVVLCLLAMFLLVPRWRSCPPMWRIAIACLIVTVPVLSAIVGRQIGSVIAFEMVGLSVLGAIAIAIALASFSPRNRSLSGITSGFLTLFTTAASDDPRAIVLAIVWMTVCVWHLIANHWERLDTCMPDRVQRTVAVRPVTALIGIGICLASGLVMRGRAGDSLRLAWQVMPASGGSTWSDPGARRGVGSGDMAIAATDRPESFGAVESQMFLESDQSTLFDMFNDTIGEPKIKPKSERRQGLGADKLSHTHQQTTKSEQGGAAFSTARTKPAKPTPLRDAPKNDVLQWIGPGGIRLAMNRYDTFDGMEWSQESNRQHGQLIRRTIDGDAWFFDPNSERKAQADCVSAGLLKVMRLDSVRIPTPMLTAAVSVKDVDRADFFGIERDGSFFMPEREKIPPLTVVHLASSDVMEDELLAPHALKQCKETFSPTTEGERLAAELADRWTAAQSTDYGKLKAIIANLRGRFDFDRKVESDGRDPLHAFLVSGRGGDHLFATAASVMCRQIGLQSRLTTGFYAAPKNFERTAGYISIGVDDVHVWAEIALSDGRWIAIEPTPGYREPVFTPSTWLLAKRFAVANWPWLAVALAGGFSFYLTRLVWLELLLMLVWYGVRLMTARHRIRVMLRILELRARAAGTPRSRGIPQRDWLFSLVGNDVLLQRSVRRCCDAADRVVFGQVAARDDWRGQDDVLVRRITTNFFRQLPSRATV